MRPGGQTNHGPAPAAVQKSALAARVEALHKRILQGEAAARNPMAEFLMEALPHLLRRFESSEVELVRDAVTDTILHYLGRPGRFWPHGFNRNYAGANRSLVWRLVGNARGRISNAQRGQIRRAAHETTVPELTWDAMPAGRPAPDQALVAAEERVWMRRCLEGVRGAFPNQRDWLFLTLWAEGWRSLEDYAEALGVSQAPPQEQVRELERAKNRVRVTLHRLRDGEGFSGLAALCRRLGEAAGA